MKITINGLQYFKILKLLADFQIGQESDKESPTVMLHEIESDTEAQLYSITVESDALWIGTELCCGICIYTAGTDRMTRLRKDDYITITIH